MTPDFDLDRYLDRIGYDGSRDATLDTLRALHARHPAAIPFENLDPLLRRPVRLELNELAAKLVDAGRGGYCFEHNTLLAAALDAMGFTVTRLAARVRFGAPADRPDGARSHMMLRVDLPEGAYLADVGFGGLLFDAPLRLVADVEQSTATSVLRLTGGPSTDAPFVPYTLQTRFGGEEHAWRDLYRFTLERQLTADYQAGNWYTSTYPTSLFVTHLLAERLTSERRISLFDRRLVVRPVGGEAEERTLASAHELGDVLGSDLGIRLPAEPEEIWARLPSP